MSYTEAQFSLVCANMSKRVIITRGYRFIQPPIFVCPIKVWYCYNCPSDEGLS